ncbi:TIGR02391 family protein [Paraburkholderia sp.]
MALWLALRNPRAHGGITNDHPERAVEYLSFLSMLARLLDRAQRA